MYGAQFEGLHALASNVSADIGSYTAAQFLCDFPQFTQKEAEPEAVSQDLGAAENEPEKEPCSLVPLPMLERFVERANDALSPQRWGTMWLFACGLYVAHYATVYLRTWAQGSTNAADAAAGGATLGLVQSASLGVDSVTYDNRAILAATEKWGGLNTTQYGQQLATQARLVGMGGCYLL